MSAWPADTVLMVRPAAFGFNPETAPSNAFQRNGEGMDPAAAQRRALAEFEAVLAALEGEGAKVLTFDDMAAPRTPDAVFPNNWLAALPGKRLFTFPMESRTRRKERRDDIISYLTRVYGYRFDNSLEAFEEAGQALEGTGSLVLDHEAKVGYAALSSRTHEAPLRAFEARSGYRAVPFRTRGPGGKPIYHTNVVMTLAPEFAVIGADCIVEADRKRVLKALERSGKQIVTLTNRQLFAGFAGNMLALKGKGGRRLLAMSGAARAALTSAQVKRFEQEFGYQLVSVAIPTLERLGGGSLRCMLAEVF